MQRVHILTDSAAHIPAALCKELDIHIVALPYTWDGTPYDDFTLEPGAFYSRLRASATVPTTSGPAPGTFKDHFETLGKDGHPVLAIVVGGQFSGTLDSALIAKEMTPGVDVTVYDSKQITMGQGFQVLAAARAAMEGKALQAILLLLNRMRGACGVLYATPHIQYLLRGGRLNHLQAFLASGLHIIPLLETNGGPIKALERVRGRMQVIPHMLALAAERLRRLRPIRMAVVHADAEAQARELAEAARREFAPDEMLVSEATPVLGIHGGPDAMALAFSSGI